ncbi:heterokaryon incompatibility protein-domain-containing protein [Podospora australis]|uniref:Heterokaryon incompatibility protein-domain-containing protein n=1 Tax=Podospora australis TaxID=1536484 RepID=A0AAN7AKB2_9PEZI|nr:heterokaryon incompatibility protein-domain-containing protein [Podospora australis]
MALSSWHERTCGRPDVSLVDGVPFCMSCGSLGALDDLQPSQAPPALPVPSRRRAKLDLSWPSSVKYAATCFNESGEEIGGVVEELVQGLEIAAESKGDQKDAPKGEGEGEGEGEGAGYDSFSDCESVSSAGTLQLTPSQKNPSPPVQLPGKDSIRLLRLSKGRGQEPLHGALEAHHLKYFPEYEALSYTWADASGNSSRTKKLYLGEEWSVFPITPNCDAALRRLRLPTKERHIWVDSVCIDQFNIEERSHQVQLMPVIYATAERVLIYLGEDEPELDMKSKHLFNNTTELTSEWDNLENMLKRPYFFRSWIIQEIASARTALVAWHGTSWRVWPIYDKIAKPNMFLPWIQQFDRRRYKTPNHLLQLIIDSWTSQAYDPRDKVFSPLGVISGAGADGLVADYSLTVEQVYTGLAAFALVKQKQSQILKYAGGYVKSASLPSWVPDWQLLSRNWDIFAQIRWFHDSESQTRFMTGHRISETRTERIRQPWLMDSIDSIPFTDTTIHSATGALCLSGMKITDLTADHRRTTIYGVGDSWNVSRTHECTAYRGLGLFVTGITAIQDQGIHGTTTATLVPDNDTSTRLSVWFLHGIDTPVILRQVVSSRSEVFSFVGPAYVWIQTGVSMRMGTGGHNGDRGSPRSVLCEPNWLTGEKLNPNEDKVLQTCGIDFAELSFTLNQTTLEACDEFRIAKFQWLGESAETTWSNTIRYQLPILFLVPSLRTSDLMLPVMDMMEDLRDTLEKQAKFWEEIISLLEVAKTFPGGQPISNEIWEQQYVRRARQLDQARRKAFDFEDQIGDNHEEVRCILKRVYTSASNRETLVERIQQFVERVADHDEGDSDHAGTPSACGNTLYVPVWYLCQDMIRSWWTNLVRRQLTDAATYLREVDRFAVINNASEVDNNNDIYGVEREQTRSKPEENLASAKRWRDAFVFGAMEADLTKKSVQILIEQRKKYVDLMRRKWESIVIL